MASYWNDPNAGKEMWYEKLVAWQWILICLASLLGLILLCCLWELFWTKICGCGDLPPSRGNSATSGDDKNDVTEITDTDEIGTTHTDKNNDEDGGDSEVDGVWNCKENKDVSVEEI